MKDTIDPERKKFSFMWMTTNEQGSSEIGRDGEAANRRRLRR
jgi:hypothetical protein